MPKTDYYQLNKYHKVTHVQFNSIAEFMQYLETTPVNDAFKYAQQASTIEERSGRKWYGTQNYKEACNLLANGYNEGIEKLNKRINGVQKLNVDIQKQLKTYLDVQGFQPCVPLYLNNVPNCMVNSKMQAKKQKILNVVKSISYSSFVAPEQITEYSVIALKIVQMLERQGYRVNLFVTMPCESHRGDVQICTIKLKSSSERLNLSKLAFPMLHPSMLRRFSFKYLEVQPDVTTSFIDSYGVPMQPAQFKQYFKGALVLPNVLHDSDIQKCNNNLTDMLSK